jgi:hypothetical protein
MLYGGTVALSYVLVTEVSPLVRDEFVCLGVTVIGAVGAIMGVRGLFRRRKTLAKWERIVAASVVLSVMAVSGVVSLTARKQRALVKLTQSRLQYLTQTLDGQVKASGLTDVVEMLSGHRDFDKGRISEANGHLGELSASLEKIVNITQGYLLECRSGLSPTDSNAMFLVRLSEKLTQMLSIKREYFAEIGRLLDFLISEDGTYRFTPQGPRFRTLKDADVYNTSLSRIIKYEEQLAVIASEINGKTLVASETCNDPHERLGLTGVCWCESGYTRDSTSLKCVK